MAVNDFYLQIIKGIELETEQYSNDLFKRIKGPILIKIQEIIGLVLRASPEYTTLRSNTSEHHQFGIPDIERLMDAVISKILRDIRLNVSFRHMKGSGGYYTSTFSIRLLDATFESILSLPEANFVTEKGYLLPWLKWLLLEGTRPVIVNFYYSGLKSPSSRTGYGIMKNKYSWGVPSNIAGTAGNNWLLRAIKQLETELPLIVETELRNYV